MVSAWPGEARSGWRQCPECARYLEQKGIGVKTSAAMVPVVPGVILYDLGIGKAHVRPTREMGEAAAAAATDGAVKEGCVGAGTGATVGKVLGMRNAMKAGLGTYTTEASGATVSALVVVNALGDVVDPETRKVVGGARQKAPDSKEFANSAELMRRGPVQGIVQRGNTTLAIVATNAQLTKVQATSWHGTRSRDWYGRFVPSTPCRTATWQSHFRWEPGMRPSIRWAWLRRRQ